MQLIQQLDTLRTREETLKEYDDALAYICVTLFVVMATVFCLILTL